MDAVALKKEVPMTRFFKPVAVTALMMLLCVAAAGMAFADAGGGNTTAPAAVPESSQAAQSAKSNPVVATVNGEKIYLSDVAKAAQSLPPELQSAPPQELYPLLVNRLVDEKALLIQARKTHLANQKKVAEAMREAADEALEAAYLRSQVEPQLTDAAIEEYYKTHYVKAKQPQQVKASQILVKTKAEADSIIDQLNKGAKFADLAKKYSIDPGGKQGGELGWFTKDEMVKPFAEAAFALTPGTYTQNPVKSQFGWHVILSEGKRTKPVPALADVKAEVKQKLAEKLITQTLEKARKSVTVVTFNPDGTPMKTGEGDATPSSGVGSKPAQ